MNFYERVYELVRRIPAGKCASYGQLALMLGNPRASRAVGYAMRACRTPGVPTAPPPQHLAPASSGRCWRQRGCPSPPTAGWSWAAAGGTVPDGFCLPFADGRDIISAY